MNDPFHLLVFHLSHCLCPFLCPYRYALVTLTNNLSQHVLASHIDDIESPCLCLHPLVCDLSLLWGFPWVVGHTQQDFLCDCLWKNLLFLWSGGLLCIQTFVFCNWIDDLTCLKDWPCLEDWLCLKDGLCFKQWLTDWLCLKNGGCFQDWFCLKDCHRFCTGTGVASRLGDSIISRVGP